MTNKNNQLENARKKRVLIISDSIKRKTGYATVARNILTHLHQTGKYELAQLGLADIPLPVGLPINYYSQVRVHGNCCGRGKVIEHVPAGDTKVQFIALDPFVSLMKDQKPCIKGHNDDVDNYGYDSAFFVVNHFQPDIVISINDIWGLYNILHLANKRHFKFAPYIAIDSECLFPAIQAPQDRLGLPHIDTLGIFDKIERPIVFTKWARNVINKTANLLRGNDIPGIDVIPHGVDTNIWKRLPNKTLLREKIFGIQPNQDIFLLGSIARNQPRKRLDAIFQTIKIFKEKYEKKRKLMCHFHCCLGDKLGWNLMWLAKYYGVEDRCIFDRNLKPGYGPEVDVMNEIANCYDAHISLTNSEGWHLPALETAAAGIPNIITKYSAHADWGKDALLFVKVAAYEHESRTGFVKAIADVEHAARQIKLLYDSPKVREEYSQKGIKLGKKLDWENIVKIWEKKIDSIDTSDLKEGRYFQFKIDHKNINLPSIPEDPINTPFELVEL